MELASNPNFLEFRVLCFVQLGSNLVVTSFILLGDVPALDLNNESVCLLKI